VDTLVRSQDTVSRSAKYSFRTLLRRLERPFAAVLIYLIEYRRAKAAEETFARLSSLSDAELAKHGIERGQISQFVRERLY
jgi:hypothetical protein